MGFITKSQLLSQSSTTKTFSAITESLSNYKRAPSYSKTSIFLSHKHNEVTELEAAISLLNKWNSNIYVDWLDDGMPKKTSGLTAKRIKNKIKENQKFILLATEAAINSKWCNWELGLGDAAKYLENIAIFPIEDDNLDFSGNEYLEIYPYIYEVKNFQYFKGNYLEKGVYVVYPSLTETSSVVPISQWLRNR